MEFIKALEAISEGWDCCGMSSKLSQSYPLVKKNVDILTQEVQIYPTSLRNYENFPALMEKFALAKVR